MDRSDGRKKRWSRGGESKKWHDLRRERYEGGDW